jgi:hypothetical protein
MYLQLAGPVPDSPAAQYAVASDLAHRASDTNFDRIGLYLDRMPTEFCVLSVRDATLRDPKIKYTAGYTRWTIQNHYVRSIVCRADNSTLTSTAGTEGAASRSRGSRPWAVRRWPTSPPGSAISESVTTRKTLAVCPD